MASSSVIADHKIGRLAITPSPRRPGLSALFGAFPTALEAAAEYRRLSGMTDAQLARRGLTRTDLAGVVFDGHYRD